MTNPGRKKMMTDTVRKMLGVEEVLALIPVSRTTLFRMEREKKFPAGHLIRGRKIWFSDELVAWQDDLPISGPRVRRRATA